MGMDPAAAAWLEEGVRPMDRRSEAMDFAEGTKGVESWVGLSFGCWSSSDHSVETAISRVPFMANGITITLVDSMTLSCE
jgi:hypothetical protein